MSEILLTVIIASYNRHIKLNNCLASLYQIIDNKNLIKCIEIIVVDQSDSKFLASTKYDTIPNYIYLQSGIKNASHARNLGAKKARGNFIWFLDDDAEVLSFNFNALLNNLDIFFISWKERSYIFDKKNLLRKLNLLRRSGTPFYILRRKHFEAVLGFCEDLGPGSSIDGGEDLDLLLRIDKYFPIKNFDIQGQITHPVNEQNLKKRRSYFYARGYVLGKNKEFFLFLLNFFYDLSLIYRYGFERVILLMSGFITGFRSIKY